MTKDEENSSSAYDYAGDRNPEKRTSLITFLLTPKPTPPRKKRKKHLNQKKIQMQNRKLDKG
jgi:hypothetical protein